ncbi:hypothetical protein L596_001326 [Steinernema carpocapsae]|uniref:Uncharacterized protein n=1 Tax=Steinernema carpocapsae TaxID=34508 RepID=A0A4U8UKX7_STECR|nr:hypothetical protein L596_001326 [Steinernema carpocapsae]
MLTSCFGDLCISPQANLSDLPQWHLIIRPIRCTSKWKHALCEVYSDGSMVCKHPQVAESADPNQRIDRIVIKECGRVFDGQEWAIMSQHTALTDLLPFILTHVSSQPVLKISGEESAEQENLLTSGRTRKLDLHGKWPSSIRYHLMAYLLSTLVPNVTISEEADLYIDQAIFDYIFEKFQMEKNSHFKVSGYLGVDPGYMKSFKLDLQRRNPEQKKGDITWVSPFNHRRTLRAVFVCDRVTIFSGKFEDY